MVLFLTTARIIFAVQDAPEPKSALDVTVIGHQFWWEFRYPKLGIVTANELHIPVSTPEQPEPTYLQLLSADVDHSFWVPQLAGKTDLIPNHPNQMWIDPDKTGLYLGQCAQFCGIEHAKMLIRVYVETPQQFAAWVKNQQQPPPQVESQDAAVAAGRHIFETEACMNCHTIDGHRGQGNFRSRFDAFDEPRNHCCGRCGQHAGEPAYMDSGSGHIQTRRADACHAVQRPADR